MGAKGPLSRTLAKILSKFASYSPQCVIVKSTPVRVLIGLTWGLLLTAAGPLCIFQIMFHMRDLSFPRNFPSSLGIETLFK